MKALKKARTPYKDDDELERIAKHIIQTLSKSGYYIAETVDNPSNPRQSPLRPWRPPNPPRDWL